MVERVVATETALALIERLKAEHGAQLMFFQSGGCCDGSAPMCYLIGELTVGRYDLLLGSIGGCEFFISQSQYEYWQNTQLIIDVTQGHGSTFSLEGPHGVCFITTSRLFTDDERQALAPVTSHGV
ncbi:MAG: DUF779 domain-containing protein [Pseudomonadota bacterium]|nr:DUF779 domain-containing protein [Pseudomonadota bacterium]